MTGVSDDNASYQYTYNADDELSTFSDAGSTGLPQVTLTYAYDADGNETSMTDSLGGVVSYTYDSRNELTGETSRARRAVSRGRHLRLRRRGPA